MNGKFNCVVKFNTGYVQNVSFYVIDCEIPPLLGFDFLNNETIESYTFKKSKLILNRKFGQKFKRNEIFFNQTEFSSYISRPNTPQESNKVQKVKELTGVKINPEAELDQKKIM